MAKKNYQIRVDELIFEKFRIVAEKNHRSIIGHITFLMEQAVNDFEEKNGNIDPNEYLNEQ